MFIDRQKTEVAGDNIKRDEQRPTVMMILEGLTNSRRIGRGHDVPRLRQRPHSRAIDGSADVCRGGPKACGVAARQTVARDTAFGLTEVRASSTWKC
jgi:hypothetical protein